VREVVREVIRTLDLRLPVGWMDPAWAVMMGIEHERIHLETSSVLIRQTALKHLKPAPMWTRCMDSGPAPANELLPVPGGRVHLGKSRDPNQKGADEGWQYGWDNEYGTHEAEIAPFKAARHLVSNGEFMAFVEAGGYREPRWWSAEGQRWVDWRKAEHPVFWRRAEDGRWLYRSMLEEFPLPLDWPVDVNYLEAKAFCNWKSAQTGLALRLPTEDEWLRLRDHCQITDEPFWDKAPGNINLEYWASSCPVGRFVFKDGFSDVIGNVWQWTETPIDGLPGFAVHPWYDDFSTPTFDNKHNLIKGGSWISTGNEANRYSRYAFRRHFFQHAGFRYVEAGPNPHEAQIEASNSGLYETDQQLSQYCEFHFGREYLDVPNFARACVDLCLKHSEGRPRNKALDLGCATGRASFELARAYPQVHGIDYTARFIRLALEMKERGEIRYEITTEGELKEARHVRLADLGLAEGAGRIEFWQGDAANLKPHFKDYDLIFAGNLIDRMANPAAFLGQAHARLKPGGLLILTSPYTWLTDFTPREHWLGGYLHNGQPVRSLDGLHTQLDPHFRLLATHDVPFVLRETARKFQHTIAQMTVWEKK